MFGRRSGGAVDLTAPLVFAGYGMTDAALGFDDYKGLDIRGRIAVVLWALPKGMDSEVGAHLQSEQARVAAAHGAVGIIRIAVLIPWDILSQFAGEPATTWVGRDGVPFDPAGGLEAGALMEPTAADTLFAGSATRLPQILDAAARGERPAGFALKTEGQLVVTTTTRRFTSPEVIGIIEGADPALKNQYVALMAHADHIGITGSGPGDHINNGALDNAAGVATLIEVGHGFAASADRPRRSIVLIANTAEEKGLLGAEDLRSLSDAPHRSHHCSHRSRHAPAPLRLHGRHRLWRKPLDVGPGISRRRRATACPADTGSCARAGDVRAFGPLCDGQRRKQSSVSREIGRPRTFDAECSPRHRVAQGDRRRVQHHAGDRAGPSAALPVPIVTDDR